MKYELNKQCNIFCIRTDIYKVINGINCHFVLVKISYSLNDTLLQLTVTCMPGPACYLGRTSISNPPSPPPTKLHLENMSTSHPLTCQITLSTCTQDIDFGYGDH